MALPRLPADSTGIDVTLRINAKLRPYFTVWYQRKKNPGETPEQFAIRYLKAAALNDYITDVAQAEMNAAEEDKKARIEAMSTDIQSLPDEIDAP